MAYRGQIRDIARYAVWHLHAISARIRESSNFHCLDFAKYDIFLANQ